MSTVQIGVYRNGAYTTRNATIEEILAANREDEHKPLAHSAKPPIYGILSRTVVRTPVLNSIIPARLRHKDHNDVIYVHDDHIEIIEVRNNGQELHHVATKADFGSRIRTARVFGELRQPSYDVSYKNGKTFSLADRLHAFSDSPMVKIEQPENNNDTTSQPSLVPPHILVLTLETPELVFLFATQGPHGLGFSTRSRPLPSNRSFLEQPGKHVAVDPKSRALAVAACEGVFILYALKSMDRIRQDSLDSPGEFDPVGEERVLPVDGVILRMEFLHPPADDHDHVLLLLVVCKNRRTRLFCYEWDSSTSLRTAGLKVRGQRLPQAERLPLLLIPLRVSSGFMLVCEHVTAFYKNIYSGTAQAAFEAEPNEGYIQLPGISRRKPLWTGWARPVRFGEAASGDTWDFTKEKREVFDVTRMTEDLYLAREDGFIKYRRFAAQPSVGGAWLPPDQVGVGNLGCNIDLAFASLDLPLLQPDLLAGGGDSSDGALYSIGGDGLGHPRKSLMSPRFMASYPNWAPVMDCALTTLAGESSLGGRGLERSFRTFVSSGRQPYGTITEIRNGYEVQIDHEYQIPQLDNAVNMWTLPAEGGCYILLSFPTFSALMFSPSPDDLDECEDKPVGIESTCETLMASISSQGQLIQVTESKVIVVRTDKGLVTRVGSCEWQSGITVTKAAIQGELIVVAKRHGLRSDAFELETARLSACDVGSSSLSQIGPSIALDSDPSCLTILTDFGHLLVLVCIGTSLCFYRLDPQLGLSFIMQDDRLKFESSGATMAVCESVATLANPRVDFALLLCGLRNGVLCTMEVDNGSINERSLGRTNFYALGDTPVKLVQESKYSVFALCGPNTCRLVWPKHSSLLISSVWFVNHDQTPFNQGPVLSLRPRYIPELVGSDTTGLYSCILGSSLFFARSSGEIKSVPRRTPIDGTPQRVIYSKHLDRLVVASMSTSVRQYQSQSTRVSRAAIHFIDPDEPTVKLENTNGSHGSPQAMSGELIGKAGERVYSLLDWTCEDKDAKLYNFLVVGTGYRDSRHGPERGRIQILKAGLQDSGKVYTKSSKEIKMSSPVYSLATCGRASFICCSGTKIALYRVSFDPPGFSSICEASLPSSGVHVTVEGNYVYVTTELHSVIVFHLVDDRFVPFSSDGMSRSGCHHLVLDTPTDQRLILTSDKQSCVVGLLQPQHRTRQNAMPIVFEAAMPRSITRLRKGNIRPPWQRKAELPGILHDDIIGAGTDGSLYAFSVLDEHSWRLLRFLENMCLRNKHLCPHTSDLMLRRLHLEPDVTRKTSFHVDGDVLLRLSEAEQGPDECLTAMLSVEPREVNDADEIVDFDSSEKRWERFEELAGDILGARDWRLQGNSVGRVVSWLRDVLTPVL